MSLIRSGIHAWFIGRHMVMKPRWWWRIAHTKRRIVRYIGNFIWGPVEDEVKRVQNKMQRGYWRTRFGKLNAPNSKPKKAMDKYHDKK